MTTIQLLKRIERNTWWTRLIVTCMLSAAAGVAVGTTLSRIL